jgi:hypothetical protein
MSANPLVPRAASRAEIVAISESDLLAVARFVADQSGREAQAVESHLRWFLLENPARRPDHPLGFCLLAANQLAGCILCSPQMFRLQTKRILLMGSSSFYVDEAHRGWSGRIFLTYCRLGKSWPLFGTSANPTAAGLWKAAGASSIPYSQGEFFGVLRWPPVMEEIAHRRSSSRVVTHLARSSASRIVEWLRPLTLNKGAPARLRLLTRAEDALNLLLDESSPKLTAERDLPYIRWRYFSGHDATTQAFAFHSSEPGKEILVTVNQRARGYRGQINTLNVLDVYPEVAPDEYVRIVGALIAHYRTTIDAVVLRCQDPARSEMLHKKGFQWRQFEAPISWLLDKADFLPTCDWYPVPADGDGLI